MVLYKKKSDTIGIYASSLCLVHCLATPLLFIAQSQMICCEGTSVPLWWKALDLFFLVISFVAIYWSVISTSKEWMKYALWTTWFVLSFILINERMQWLSIPEYAIYFPSLSLVFLHFYNRKFCHCKEDRCCVNSKVQ
ncbi:MerC domain-containing protein [uncultured Kordia sp.]|uniref:MerC domain-containing protein n=1 Tax=uncultured Kordia sp. TaxID=507699 RepID=UPI00261E5794|nr:MerC domain-containing protein [uncultured Kordia sp.]